MTTFDDRNVWVFDLDNTLYPAECDLFSLVSDKMNEFIQNCLKVDLETAKSIRREYYLTYGTTLAGLMKVHNVQPDGFLDFVHDIDHSVLEENQSLRAAISRLPGRKLIYTNGSTSHAEGVAGKIGILDLFEDIFDIKASNYIPKRTGMLLNCSCQNTALNREKRQCSKIYRTTWSQLMRWE